VAPADAPVCTERRINGFADRSRWKQSASAAGTEFECRPKSRARQVARRGDAVRRRLSRDADELEQSLFGGDNSAEQTWQSMLNDERSQAIAKDGSFGLASQLENQLRNQVLGDASHEAHVDVDKRMGP
jgi:Rod binding domain-containing protein